MRIGGVNLEDGKILNLVLESIPTAPTFNSQDVGEFTFSLNDRVLRFNDGQQLISLNTSISEDPNLKSSLGSNWLNPDLTFNPVPFNDLPGITDLDSNDSLFVVIEQIADLLQNVSTVTLDEIDLTNVFVEDLMVMTYLGGDLIFLEIEQILEGSTISLNFDNLEGFNIDVIDDGIPGNLIIFDNNQELVSRTVHYKYENLALGTSHLVTHGLNKLHCSVFCINPATNQVSTPDSIEFISENSLIVDFSTAQGLIAFITNLEA